MLNLVKTTVFCRYAYNMCKPKKTPQAFLQKHYLLKLQLKKPRRIILPEKIYS